MIKSLLYQDRIFWRKIRLAFAKLFHRMTPSQNLLFGFGIYTLAGWLLLCLPIVQKNAVGMLDNLFIATSAISTTGLATLSVSDNYNLVGQLIVLLLIQIGGVGYMSFGSFIILSKRSPLNLVRRKVLLTEFTMPEGFDLKDFIKSIFVFTITIELIGAILLYFSFIRLGVAPTDAIWSSIFHSVSSFCTAGFGLYNNSFETYAMDPGINWIVSILSILGAIGFIVVTDFWYWIKGKRKTITHTSKAILLVLFSLLFLGTSMLYFYEPSIQNYNSSGKLLTAFFQSMTALTTVGFNTIPISLMSLPALMFLVLLMYVGASPSGTGGGLKSTTFTAMLAILWNKLRGNTNVVFLGKIIPTQRLYIATSSFILYTAVLFLATFLLTATEIFPLSDVLFEAASALGTVGLSTGITASLTSMGKIVVIMAMFIGRVGVITIGLSILARKKPDGRLKEKADLAV